MHPETLVSPRRNWQDFTLNVLNGNSLGIIIALLPPALTSQVLLLFGQHPWVRLITMMTNVSQSMLPIIAAFAVGYFLRLSTLASASIGLASVVSAGVVTINPNNTYSRYRRDFEHYACHVHFSFARDRVGTSARSTQNYFLAHYHVVDWWWHWFGDFALDDSHPKCNW